MNAQAEKKYSTVNRRTTFVVLEWWNCTKLIGSFCRNTMVQLCARETLVVKMIVRAKNPIFVKRRKQNECKLVQIHVHITPQTKTMEYTTIKITHICVGCIHRKVYIFDYNDIDTDLLHKHYHS